MPCWELFEAQPEAYRSSVLPAAVTARVTIEAGRTIGWERYAGSRGACVGVDRFGASAPGPEVAARLGLTVDDVVAAARRVLAA
jgi:transketolase